MFLPVAVLLILVARIAVASGIQDGRIFYNPILDEVASDPSVLFYNGTYLMTHTTGDSIIVRQSNNLVNWRASKVRVVDGPLSTSTIWSPSIHLINHEIYIYFSQFKNGLNDNRIHVVKAQDASRPLGEYEYLGIVEDSRNLFWANDPTVLQTDDKNFLVYSGKPTSTGVQQIYIAEMSSPTTLVPGSTKKLFAPEYAWEKVGEPSLQGPAILDHGEHYFLVYSASQSTSPDHCMGMAYIHKSKPVTDVSQWTRLDRPVFGRLDFDGVFGPGHPSFTVSPDNNEVWMVYHAMENENDFGRNRKARAQRITFNELGMPEFPRPAGYQTALTKPNRGQNTMFRNPITDFKAADPWILQWNGSYHFIVSVGDLKLRLYKSNDLSAWYDADYVDIFTPPEGTMYSKELWAPEIHYVRGNFYVYFAADDGDNLNHRMYALQADDPNEPMGSYTFKGKVADPKRDWWAIDGGVWQHENGRLYWAYSGWDNAYTYDPRVQHQFIAEMSDPLTVIPGSSVLIKSPTYEWEKRTQAVIEGQSIIEHDDQYFLMYSASASWTANYAIGMMGIKKNRDPLKPENWYYSDHPVFTRNDAEEVYGVGHASFTKSPDGSEDWIVYHAMDDPNGHWKNRSPRIQRYWFGPDGLPVFTAAIGFDTAQIVPSGTLIV